MAFPLLNQTSLAILFNVAFSGRSQERPSREGRFCFIKAPPVPGESVARQLGASSLTAFRLRELCLENLESWRIFSVKSFDFPKVRILPIALKTRSHWVKCHHHWSEIFAKLSQSLLLGVEAVNIYKIVF